MSKNKFESKFRINERVVLLGKKPADVVAVTFTEDKVLYDLDLTEGGETIQRVDASFVSSTQ